MRLPALALACSLAASSASALDKPDAKMVVVVLYFDNNSNDRGYDVLQKGLADMLVTDLSGVDGLEVVEREKLQKLVEELKLQRTSYFDPKTAQKLGKGIGARYAITGSLAALDPQMRIDVRLVDVGSARVVMADKVVGMKDKFFDLQQLLVSKFVAGLDLKAAKGESRSGVADVAALLQYSKGVDAADRGDLKGASQQLAEVIKSSPDFTMAKDKYTELVRKLREAAKRRESSLESDETILLRNIEAALQQELSKLEDERQVQLYFGNRIARGNYYLWKAKLAAGSAPGQNDSVWIPRNKRPEVASFAKIYVENTVKLIGEIRATRERMKQKERHWRVEYEIDPEDRRRGKELGISDEIEEWTFVNEHRAQRALADFLLSGKAPFWTDVRFTARPSLAETDPAQAKRAFALLEDARKEIARSETGEQLVTAVAETTDIHAEGLIVLGRKEEAIAQWQSFLDTYPKATQYREFEVKVEDLLGISAAAEKFDKALKACSQELFMGLYDAVNRTARADGTKGVRRLVDRITGCSSGPMAVSFALQAYMMGAKNAVSRGDCAFALELKERALKLGPMYSAPVEQAAAGCQ